MYSLRKSPQWMFGTALLALCLYPGLANAENLRLGVFPYLSPSKLVHLHLPLKQQLDSVLTEPLALVSAPSFKAFKQRTTEASYDLLITAPHLGRAAERNGYRWLAFTRNTSHAVFVAPPGSPVKRISDLRQHRLAVPPRSAIVHHLALHSVRQAGVAVQQIELEVRNSHDNALLAALRDDADAAAIGYPTWARHKAAGEHDLVVLGQSEDIPGFAIMVHQRVPPAVIESLRQALFDFDATPVGAHYFDKTALKGVRAPTAADFALLDRYLNDMESQ